MSKLDIMKERYDQTIIPAELSLRIQQEIQNSRKQQRRNKRGWQEPQVQKGNTQCGSSGSDCMYSFHNSFEYESGICKRSRATSGDRRSGSDIDIPFL